MLHDEIGQARQCDTALGDSGARGLRAQCFPEREKKEGTSARRALRYCPLWRSDGDYTLFGATVDRLIFRVGLSEGTGNSVLATLRIRVGDCLHRSASSDVAYFGARDLSPNRVVR